MFILETLNFVVDILKVPAILVGLIALIGLVAQKKSFSDVVKGTIKTILAIKLMKILIDFNSIKVQLKLQISIPLYVSDIFGKADALIYALWVDVVHRRQGVAQHLLQLAEQQAKLNGVKTIGLEFNKDESDRFVLDWYLRSGYKPFDKKSNLLIKKVED